MIRNGGRERELESGIVDVQRPKSEKQECGSRQSVKGGHFETQKLGTDDRTAHGHRGYDRGATTT